MNTDQTTANTSTTRAPGGAEAADAPRAAEYDSPACPHCEYDQSGEVARWDAVGQCPLKGRCPECGETFIWREVFTKLRAAVDLHPFDLRDRQLSLRVLSRTYWRILLPWLTTPMLRRKGDFSLRRTVLMTLAWPVSALAPYVCLIVARLVVREVMDPRGWYSSRETPFVSDGLFEGAAFRLTIDHWMFRSQWGIALGAWLFALLGTTVLTLVALALQRFGQIEATLTPREAARRWVRGALWSVVFCCGWGAWLMLIATAMWLGSGRPPGLGLSWFGAVFATVVWMVSGMAGWWTMYARAAGLRSSVVVWMGLLAALPLGIFTAYWGRYVVWWW